MRLTKLYHFFHISSVSLIRLYSVAHPQFCDSHSPCYKVLIDVNGRASMPVLWTRWGVATGNGSRSRVGDVSPTVPDLVFQIVFPGGILPAAPHIFARLLINSFDLGYFFVYCTVKARLHNGGVIIMCSTAIHVRHVVF